MMSSANRVVKNTGYLYMKMAITMFISLYTTRLVLNSLGDTDFGIFSVVGGAIGLLSFLNSAMASATQRFMSFYEGANQTEKLKEIFNVSVVLHFIIALLSLGLLILAGFVFFNGVLTIPEERYEASLVIYGSLIISTAFTIAAVPYDAVINAHENFLYYTIIGIIESLLKLAVAFAVVYTNHDKLIVYGVLMSIIPLLTLTALRIYCHLKYAECQLNVRRFYSKDVMKQMSSFAGWNFMGSMASIIGNYGNGILLNHFFGAKVNAAAGVTNQLNGQLMVFSNNMLKAINPAIVKKEGEGDNATMLKYSYLGCKYSYLLFCVFGIPMFIEAPYVLELWLKHVPEWSVAFCRFYVIGTLIEKSFFLLGTSLAAHGTIKEINIASVFFFLLHLPILCLMFSLGASLYWYFIIIIFFLDIVHGCVKIYYAKKLCGLDLNEMWLDVYKPCMIFTIIMMAVGCSIYYLLNEGIVRLITTIVATSLTFVGVYLVISPKQEIDAVKHLIISMLCKLKLYAKIKLC